MSTHWASTERARSWAGIEDRLPAVRDRRQHSVGWSSSSPFHGAWFACVERRGAAFVSVRNLSRGTTGPGPTSAAGSRSKRRGRRVEAHRSSRVARPSASRLPGNCNPRPAREIAGLADGGSARSRRRARLQREQQAATAFDRDEPSIFPVTHEPDIGTRIATQKVVALWLSKTISN